MQYTVHYGFSLPYAVSESKRLGDMQMAKTSLQEIDLALKNVSDSKVSVSDFTTQMALKASNTDLATGLAGKADQLTTQAALNTKPTLDINGKIDEANLPDYVTYSELKTTLVQGNNYSVLPTDSGRIVVHPSTDASARTISIPAGLRVGTCITFVNENGAGTLTISNADTMRLAGPGTTGNRTLTANGAATAMKLPSGSWLISGTNLT